MFVTRKISDFLDWQKVEDIVEQKITDETFSDFFKVSLRTNSKALFGKISVRDTICKICEIRTFRTG